MELQDYPTEIILKHLKDYRGIKLKSYSSSKDIKLKPYFKEIDSSYAELISKWEGHYGLSSSGSIMLCTSDGKRIESGSLLSIFSNGIISTISGVRSDTSIKVDKNHRIVVQ